MNQNLAFADYAVFIIYFIVVSVYGYTVYRKRKQDEQDAKAYFLAEGNLTWWAIGASLIASNISAEQFIGLSGEGFFLGIAVAAYEWLAAVAYGLLTDQLLRRTKSVGACVVMHAVTNLLLGVYVVVTKSWHLW